MRASLEILEEDDFTLLSPGAQTENFSGQGTNRVPLQYKARLYKVLSINYNLISKFYQKFSAHLRHIIGFDINK